MTKDKSDFKSFFQALTEEQKVAFATEAVTTVGYIETHLIYSRKVPKKKLMDGLERACQKFNAGFTRAELLEFFYPPQQVAA